MPAPKFFKTDFDALATGGAIGHPNGELAYGYLRVSSAGQADEGAHAARIETWDGKQWHVTSSVYQSDLSVIRPIIKASAEKYAAENKITPRDCSKEK